MALNNSGSEKIFLVNPQGQAVDEQSYEGASSGHVFLFN